MSISCWAAMAAKEPLQPYTYEPKELGPWEVEIAISHCGLCHTDLHLISDDFGWDGFPLVPGHEVVGTVRALGSAVSRFAIGQRVAVGWQRSSCMECEWCLRGEENCCPGQQATCVGHYGGFAEAIQIDSRFVFPMPNGLASESAAPLLCGGITVYSPLRQDARPWSRVGVIGVGGLGHMAIQFARAFGCEVTAFSTTPAKQQDALRLGAHHFVNSRDPAQMAKCARSFDLLLDAVPAELDWATWINLLRPKGALTVVGASTGMITVPIPLLLLGQVSLRGSLIGSRSAIDEMLRFAALHGITAQVEVMPMADVNAALDRMRRNEARYRIVLKN